jgi:Domain of unknown function (DUF932)
MQRGLDLQNFASKITAAIPLKKDIVAPTQRARMRYAGGEGPEVLLMEVGKEGAYPLRDIAHGQIAEWSGIPAKYYNRMRAEAPELLASNVNRWFDDGDKRMFRTIGGNMRAFLSNRYRRIENEEIARAALPILHEAPGLQIRALEITERRMYIYATDKNVRAEVKVGDVVEAGVKISNSEIGQGSASVEPVVFRLTCLNGATMKDTRLRATHVGRQVSEGEDLNAIFADDTRRVDDNALLLKMRDVIRWAMSEAALKSSTAKLRQLTTTAIAGDPVQAVEVLSAKIGANEGEKADILSALIKGADLSAWGLVNAVTYQAHKAESFDRAVEFEDLGGKLALMPAKEWEPILAAA